MTSLKKALHRYQSIIIIILTIFHMASPDLQVNQIYLNMQDKHAASAIIRPAPGKGWAPEKLQCLQIDFIHIETHESFLSNTKTYAEYLCETADS